MAYKIAIVLLSLLVGSWSANVGPRISDTHNIDQCDNFDNKKSESVLLSNVYEDAAILPIEKTINVPETGELSTAINCIKVLNQDSSSHGGYPRILNGGIGSKNVQIELKSQLLQPLNFRIEVYREK
ncbi:probable salivary secreted peptide [Anoplophora glabripennis]|uniref:probable salivary secreted peptide n=1 Tax=Anoplophora glabripennis TaxID=217634 RepID=UPI00087583C1|nr:probable salivary secreted peptide [Anoplophora glabripennis]